MTVLDDPTLSYNAIGVYFQMRANETNPELTFRYLAGLHKSDQSSVKSAIDELYKAGWVQLRVTEKDGKITSFLWSFPKKEASR